MILGYPINIANYSDNDYKIIPISECELREPRLLVRNGKEFYAISEVANRVCDFINSLYGLDSYTFSKTLFELSPSNWTVIRDNRGKINSINDAKKSFYIVVYNNEVFAVTQDEDTYKYANKLISELCNNYMNVLPYNCKYGIDLDIYSPTDLDKGTIISLKDNGTIAGRNYYCKKGNRYFLTLSETFNCDLEYLFTSQLTNNDLINQTISTEEYEKLMTDKDSDINHKMSLAEVTYYLKKFFNIKTLPIELNEQDIRDLLANYYLVGQDLKFDNLFTDMMKKLIGNLEDIFKPYVIKRLRLTDITFLEMLEVYQAYVKEVDDSAMVDMYYNNIKDFCLYAISKKVDCLLQD